MQNVLNNGAHNGTSTPCSPNGAAHQDTNMVNNESLMNGEKKCSSDSNGAKPVDVEDIELVEENQKDEKVKDCVDEGENEKEVTMENAKDNNMDCEEERAKDREDGDDDEDEEEEDSDDLATEFLKNDTPPPVDKTSFRVYMREKIDLLPVPLAIKQYLMFYRT